MPTVRLSIAIVLTGTAAALGACRHEPVTRAALIEDAPPLPAPAATSRFSVPLDYDFTAVLRTVERVVPHTFGSMDSVRVAGNDSRRHFAFEADRSPFVAFADSSHVHLQATLAYQVRGWYKPVVGPTIGAGCGSDTNSRPRIVVELAAPLSLTDDWHLASHSRIVRVEPASTLPQDHCSVSILHRDITDQVVEAARKGINAHLADIDHKVGQVDLTPRVRQWWAMLSRPIRLTDGVWLLLGPERLAMGRVVGHGHVVTVPVTLAARPRIVTSVDAPRVDTTALPPLGRDSTADGFHILMDGLIDYASASRAVARAIDHKSVTEAGKTVTVDTAIIRPAPQGRLVLVVVFSGDARGQLHFIGRPVLDATHAEITVPDLDYNLDTDDQLINTYSWIRSDALRAAMREKAHVPVAEALARGRELLLKGLNRQVGKVMTLSATVDSVSVKGLYVTRAGLVVRAEASGRAAVSVKQK
ncbi:MAG TPA: DUF4403 family protein [Gemmatimonadaceae bacterium]|nr:DUF4403 family protein [Gemmatimonadaceae bacterium]